MNRPFRPIIRWDIITSVGFIAFWTVMLIVMCTTNACTDDNKTVHTLNDAGYSNIHTTGYTFFGCGEQDYYHTTFTALNPAGKNVSGIVCCGILKGCTIRF
jgi:hypothetical protein